MFLRLFTGPPSTISSLGCKKLALEERWPHPCQDAGRTVLACARTSVPLGGAPLLLQPLLPLGGDRAVRRPCAVHEQVADGRDGQVDGVAVPVRAWRRVHNQLRGVGVSGVCGVGEVGEMGTGLGSVGFG